MAMHSKGRKSLIYIVAAALLIVAAVKFVPVGGQQAKANAETAPQEEVAAPAPAPVTTPDTAPSAASVTIDVEAALAPRIMGDEKAPVTVEEFASLTCNHCAHFSKTTFDAFKTKYIDTGKVRFIYNDFPLNAPAMEAAMIARCLPADRYFQFIKFLFETQDQWAFNQDYRAALKQNSKLLGMSDETYDACAANEKLKAGLVEKMQAASTAHEIASTPTFVINGTEKLGGTRDLPEFEKIIDPLLEAPQ